MGTVLAALAIRDFTSRDFDYTQNKKTQKKLKSRLKTRKTVLFLSLGPKIKVKVFTDETPENKHVFTFFSE